MKLQNMIVIEEDVLCHFGDAKIVKTWRGRHKLVGGSKQDQSDARDWIALFCPEITIEEVPAPRSCVNFGVRWSSGKARGTGRFTAALAPSVYRFEWNPHVLFSQDLCSLYRFHFGATEVREEEE